MRNTTSADDNTGTGAPSGCTHLLEVEAVEGVGSNLGGCAPWRDVCVNESSKSYTGKTVTYSGQAVLLVRACSSLSCTVTQSKDV